MSYAVVSDVQGLCPFVNISATSHPTTVQVTAYLTDCSAMIDAALKSYGVGVPITAPAEFVAELKALEAMGAAGKVMIGIMPTSPSTVYSQSSAYWKTFTERLKDFRSGKGIPVAVGMAELDAAPRDAFTDGEAIPSPGEDAWGDTLDSEPAFTREKVI